MTRDLEMLHEPLKELQEDAQLLGVLRQPNEPEECFRTRCAYVMGLQIGRPITGKMLLRAALWGQVAMDYRDGLVVDNEKGV